VPRKPVHGTLVSSLTSRCQQRSRYAFDRLHQKAISAPNSELQRSGTARGPGPPNERQTMSNEENEPSPVNWSQCDLVRSHPDFLCGAWCLRSAPRMPADAIVQNWDAGHSVEELSGMWVGITREQIEGILHFARGDRSP
jgi:uncharacterized protein (DUF433 family)